MAMTLGLAPLAPGRTEHALVADARDGDDRAFEELYSRYRERIGTFIFSKVQDHGRAEDIAQEVFISALRRLRSSDQAIAFKPWIYEIAKNACIDEFRRFKRTREVSLDAEEELGTGNRGLLSIAATPPAAAENKQQLDDLQGAFGGLSESHHKLLVMREFEGLSYTEIGARTGMSRQVVESTLFRARRKLTEEYDEIASGRRCEQVIAMIAEGRAQSLRSCGVRQRRQLTRHLAHCQPCRREARLAGVDESFVKPRSIAAKIAALLPFPLWHWPWGGHGAGQGTAAKAGSVGAGKGAAAKAGSAGAGSLQSVATTVAGTAAPSITIGQAAATVSALLIAGVGGGAATGVWSASRANQPISVRTVSSSAPGGSANGAQRVVGGAGGAAGLSAAKAHRAGAALRVAGHQPRRLSHAGHATAGRRGGTAAKPGPPTGANHPAAVAGAAGPRPAGTQAQSSGSGSATTSIPRKVTGTTRSTVSGVHKVVKSVAPSAPIPPALSSTTQKVTSAVGSTTQTVTSAVGDTTQKVTSAVGDTTQKVTSAVGGATSQLGSTVKGATNKVTSKLGSTATQVGSTVTGTTDNVTSKLGDAATQLGSVGKGAASAGKGAASAGKGVTSTAEGATSAVTDAADQASSAATQGASSPLP